MRNVLVISLLLIGTPSLVHAEAVPACKEGKITDCFKAGQAYAQGSGGVKQDLSRAAKYFAMACEGEHARACYGAGLLYDIGDEPNLPLAAKMYARACDGGKAKGCTSVAQMYREGRGVKADAARAMAFSTKGCEADDPLACLELGVLHQSNDEWTKARALYERACDMEAGAGCFNLALLHEQGQGVRKSQKNADAWYEKGCGYEHPESCYYSGVAAYKRGESKNALRRWNKACDKGLAPACKAAAKVAPD